VTGLLIFIGLILIILNVLSIKKQNKSFNGVLGNAMGNIQDYDIAMGKLRREFSESILKLQSEIMDVKENMKKNNRLNKNYEALQNQNNIKTIIDETKQDQNDKIVVDELKNTSIVDETRNEGSEKVEEIKRLFNEGLTLDEISEMLHLGKGEVLLIKDLYIR